MTTWPECELAGKTCTRRYEDCPEAFVKGTGPCDGRDCLAFHGYPYCVQVDDCVACPVPKLIAAVRAAREYVPCSLEDAASQALASALAAIAVVAAVKDGNPDATD